MTLLVEKYRPKDFSEVVGLEGKVSCLTIEALPHFLFLGPAGCGKTTTARIIVTKSGSECLTLNASDERGIDTVRDKVKTFAMTRSMNGKVKIVFLDEADALTAEAQAVLRNLMETYHSNCRFIITGNYENKIIDPIKSRCVLVRFGQASEADITRRLLFVCEAEGIMHDEAGVALLAKRCKGDLRKAINRLQELAEAGVNEKTAGALDSDERVLRLYKACRQGRPFDEVRQAAMALGMDERDLVRMLFEAVLSDSTLGEQEKFRLVACFVDADRSLYFAANREIVVAGVLVDLRPR